MKYECAACHETFAAEDIPVLKIGDLYICGYCHMLLSLSDPNWLEKIVHKGVNE